MTQQAILKELKAKEFRPIYFLESEEPFYIDQIVEYIEKEVLPEETKSFNQIIMYGKETNFKQVLDQAMQFPMMSEKRVVILKEAQEMSTFDKLEGYFKNPSETTLLVIAYKHKKFDKRKKKLWEALKKNAAVLETKKIYDNQIPPLVTSIAKEHQLVIQGREATLIAENLGNNLSKINNEIKKLALNLAPGTTVNKDHIETYIGISKDYNVFELQKAIGERHKTKAYKIIQYFSQNSKAHPIQMHVGSLYGYFCKLFLAKKYQTADDRTFASKVRVNPFFAKEYKQAAKNYDLSQIKLAFQLIHEMDKKSKGVDVRRADTLGIYQEFLFKLFN